MGNYPGSSILKQTLLIIYIIFLLSNFLLTKSTELVSTNASFDLKENALEEYAVMLKVTEPSSNEEEKKNIRFHPYFREIKPLKKNVELKETAISTEYPVIQMITAENKQDKENEDKNRFIEFKEPIDDKEKASRQCNIILTPNTNTNLILNSDINFHITIPNALYWNMASTLNRKDHGSTVQFSSCDIKITNCNNISFIDEMKIQTSEENANENLHASQIEVANEIEIANDSRYTNEHTEKMEIKLENERENKYNEYFLFEDEIEIEKTENEILCIEKEIHKQGVEGNTSEKNMNIGKENNDRKFQEVLYDKEVSSNRTKVHTEESIKNNKQLSSILRNINDICKYNKMDKEVHEICINLKKLIEQSTKKIYTSMIDTNNSVDCCIHNICCYLKNSKKQFLNIENCKNPLDIIDSLDMLHLYLAMISKLKKKNSFEMSTRVRREIYKECLIREYISTGQHFSQFMKNPLYGLKLFLIKNDIQIRAKIKMLKYLFCNAADYENSFFSENKLEEVIIQLHSNLIDLSALIFRNKDTNKHKFRQLYDVIKISESIYCIKKYKINIRECLKYFKYVMQTKCMNDVEVMNIIYYKFGGIVMILFRLYDNEAYNFDLIESFMNYTKASEKLLVAIHLLSLSKGSLNFRKRSDVEEIILYYIMLYCRLKIFQMFFTHIHNNMNHIVNIVNGFIRSNEEYMSSEQCDNIHSHITYIRDFISTLFTFIHLLKNNKEHINYMNSIIQFTNYINLKVCKLVSVYKEIMKNANSEKEVHKGEKLYEEIVFLYKELFKKL